jgi:hypothetical protein
MSSGQKSMLSAVRRVFCAAMLSAACLAGATPPTPPAVLQIAREAECSRVQTRDGALEVPFRIVRSGEVSRLAVHVRVRPTDPLAAGSRIQSRIDVELPTVVRTLPSRINVEVQIVR